VTQNYFRAQLEAWWKFSRCENSARVQRAERTTKIVHTPKALRRCTRRWFSQRENRHHQALWQSWRQY
jgi:hypothetical protein